MYPCLTWLRVTFTIFYGMSHPFKSDHGLSLGDSYHEVTWYPDEYLIPTDGKHLPSIQTILMQDIIYWYRYPLLICVSILNLIDGFIFSRLSFWTLYPHLLPHLRPKLIIDTLWLVMVDYMPWFLQKFLVSLSTSAPVIKNIHNIRSISLKRHS